MQNEWRALAPAALALLLSLACRSFSQPLGLRSQPPISVSGTNFFSQPDRHRLLHPIPKALQSMQKTAQNPHPPRSAACFEHNPLQRYAVLTFPVPEKPPRRMKTSAPIPWPPRPKAVRPPSRRCQGFLTPLPRVDSLCKSTSSRCFSRFCSPNRPRRLARPRTPPFHGDNTGSNPVGDANRINKIEKNHPVE